MNTCCDLCAATGPVETSEGVALCAVCGPGVLEPKSVDERHWFCLRDSIWSDRSAVKILSYRVLKRLGDHPLAQELLGQIYLDENDQQIADAGLDEGASEDGDDTATVDSNGTPLAEGDTVTLIKDLEVKGANFTAKRGTTVKGITLTGDPKYVEGKVNGIRIVLVAAYLKKA